MTHGAFAIDVMLALRRVTRQAESTIRHEASDCRCLVARIATAVRLDGLRVRLRRIKAGVAARAIPRRRVMLIVAGYAGDDRRIGMQRDRGGMTLHARQVRVGLMLKGDLPLPRCMFGHGDRHGQLVRSPNLVSAMTRGALTLRGVLVMAGEAPARRRERQLSIGISGRVAGDASKLLVGIVGERICRSQNPGC